MSKNSGAGFRKAIEILATDGLPLALLVAWYLGSQSLPEYILPNPIDVFWYTIKLLGADPGIAWHTLVSLIRVVCAVAFALIIGFALALAAHYVWWARRFIVDRVLPFVNAFPTLGWAILGLFWLGVSDSTVLLVETAILIPFTLINCMEGLKNLDDELVEMGESFSKHRWIAVRLVVVPQLLPYVMGAVRVSYGVAWKVALIAELFGSSAGLGYLMNIARQQLNSPLLFATIVTIIVLVFTVDYFVLQKIERRLAAHRALKT